MEKQVRKSIFGFFIYNLNPMTWYKIAFKGEKYLERSMNCGKLHFFSGSDSRLQDQDFVEVTEE